MGLFCVKHDWVCDGKIRATYQRFGCPYCEIERLRELAYTPKTKHPVRCDCAVCVPF